MQFKGTLESPRCFYRPSPDAVAGEQVSYQQSRVATVATNTHTKETLNPRRVCYRGLKSR